MNENSQQLMHIKTWLDSATDQLEAVGIKSARLDAEIILDHTIRKNRTYLHAHDDELLDARTLEIADARLALRLDRVPVAYIIGHKEFYGRRFNVTTATLIPRPESEAIIDVLKDLMPKNQALLPERNLKLVDVGTGSGNLGITAKLELQELEVTLLDNSSQALKVAERNREQLGADVRMIKSDLLTDYPFQPDIIVANLPYVDPSWERSPETNYEPSSALFADKGGLALINKLIVQASTRLTPKGKLLLEADPEQHATITQFAHQHGFQRTRQQDYCLVFEKST